MDSGKLWTEEDVFHMRSSLSMARRGLGMTWPNPSVGCVVVKNGHVLARSVTAQGGRPHAEPQALEQAGEEAHGATLYVTLEPCSHQGQTPPCVQAIIRFGVSRVVIAMPDPDPRVNGRGITLLKNAGIHVECGLLQREAESVLKGYILNRTQNRPLVTLKIASTLDGKIALANGQSRWITNEYSRARGHVERARHDAIAVGINTVLTDNPNLLPRISGLSHAPVRIVFDTNLRLPDTAQIVASDPHHPVWVFTSHDKDSHTLARYPHISILNTEPDGTLGIKLSTALSKLADRGVTSLLVEGGGTLVTSFLKEGLFDRVLWFRAPSLLGRDALSAIGTLDIHDLLHRLSLTVEESIALGTDRLDILVKGE